MNLEKLSDQQLTDHLSYLFTREKQIGDSILLVLKEIKFRRIYASLGYSSLFEMLVQHFHLSETSSYQRLNALKLMESVPVAAKEIFTGDLSLTNAATLQSFIQRVEKGQNKPLTIHEKTELVNEIKNKSAKEAQQILAAINPSAVIPKQKEKIITEQITQLQILVDQQTLDQLKQVQNLLSHSIPDGDYNQILKFMTKEMIVILQKRKGIYNRPTENINLKNNSPCTKTAVNTMIAKNKSDHKLERMNSTGNSVKSEVMSSTKNSTKSLSLSNDENSKSLPMTVKQDVKADDDVKIFDDAKVAEIIKDVRNSSDVNDNNEINTINTSRYISAELKKNIFTKARNRCQYVSPEGLRCNGQHQLEIDHLRPLSQGGSNLESNLRLLCRTHNQYRTKYTHGFWYQPRSARTKIG